jgi:hypothetical protein
VDNMTIYEAVRSVPNDALKAITAGRLSGKSDINPMWRIKSLTEQFGPCGIGWKYEITKQWLETGANGEIAAFVNIDLYVKYEGEWSAAIPGTGGSSFVAKESKGLYTSDECFKMALTDAISVSCKALGFAADVYWNSDSTKYSKQPQVSPAPSQPKKSNLITPAQFKELNQMIAKTKISGSAVADYIAGQGIKVNSPQELTQQQAESVINWLVDQSALLGA